MFGIMVATQQESTVSTTWTMTHEEERSVASQKTDEDMENCREAYWIPPINKLFAMI
jgi:hypothetical protein